MLAQATVADGKTDAITIAIAATRKKLALQVGAGLLVDEAAAANARKRALANSRRVADDVERARQLAAVH